MTVEDREKAFLKSARSALDREAEKLDHLTALRLKRARLSALGSHAPSLGRWWRPFRLPAAVMAIVIVAAVTATFFFRSPALEDPRALADLDLLTSGENLELLDDLDFYYWLAETKPHAG